MSRLARSEPDRWEEIESELTERAIQDRIDALINGEGEDG